MGGGGYVREDIISIGIRTVAIAANTLVWENI